MACFLVSYVLVDLEDLGVKRIFLPLCHVENMFFLLQIQNHLQFQAYKKTLNDLWHQGNEYQEVSNRFRWLYSEDNNNVLI